MAEVLQQRANERKVYEEIVNLIVNYVHAEYKEDEPARLRIYKLVADNFDGLVRAFTVSTRKESSLIDTLEEVTEDE